MSLINPMASANIMTPAVLNVQIREGREQNLRSDQVIRATVAEGGFERALLQLGGRKFWVHTETPLATGQKVNLQMVETEQGQELRLLQTSLVDRIRQSIHLIGNRFEILPLLRELTAAEHPLFKQLSSASRNALQGALLFFDGQTEGSDGRFLKSLVRVLGLDFEHRIGRGDINEAMASLKGALQEILQRIDGRDDNLSERIRHLHQMLEAFQIFRYKLEQDGMILVPLPFPFIEYGYLLAEHQGQRNGQPETGSNRINLYLQMSALGELAIEMLFDARGLTLRIKSRDKETNLYLKSYRKELEELLETCQLTGITFSDDAIKPQQQLINLLTRGRDAVLNARI